MLAWYNKSRNRLLLALLINLLILVVYLILFFPSYEAGDDNAIMNLACGVYGSCDPHVIYQNYILGWIYVHLYQLRQSIPWYALMQYLLLFVSLTAATYCLMEYLEDISLLPLIIIILLFFSYEVYIKIQYTKAAGIAASAGLLMVFFALAREKIDKRFLLSGIVLAFAGSLYRLQEFFCIAAIFTIPIVYLLLNLKERPKAARLRMLGSSALACCLLLLLVFGSVMLDRSRYQSEEWSSYMEFNEKRAELVDYRIPLYRDHPEEYEEIGLDKSAVMLLRRLTFQDAERFNTEVFEKIIDIRGRHKLQINRAFIKDFIKEFCKGLIEMEVFWCFLLLLLCCLIGSHLSLSRWITAIYAAALVCGLYFYLFCRGRFMIHRVDVGIWFAMTLILLFVFKPDKHSVLRPAGIVLLAAVIVFTQYYWKHRQRVNMAGKEEKIRKEREALQTVHADRDHLYLKKIGKVTIANSYGVFEQAPFGIGDNTYSIGGWVSQTETVRQVLDKYNVNNPLCFRDMIDNDQVYLIHDNPDLLVTYLRHWYAPDVRAEKVKTIGRYDVFRLTTE